MHKPGTKENTMPCSTVSGSVDHCENTKDVSLCTIQALSKESKRMSSKIAKDLKRRSFCREKYIMT